MTSVLIRLFLPLLGTTAGAALVYFVKDRLSRGFERALTGFAAGVMTAASVWSLLIPAMDQSAHLGKLAFLPAAVGFWVGIFFLMLLDRIIPHLHQNSSCPEGMACGLGRSTMMVLAVRCTTCRRAWPWAWCWRAGFPGRRVFPPPPR